MTNSYSIKINKDHATNVKPYYLGLDIGTSSIGYAITDKQYNIIKKGKKALWGVRLFEEAQTAATRRGFRSSRRNKNRRNQRIKLLQEYFSEEISKVDPGFYLRLKESFFHIEDKLIKQKNTLFNDDNFSDDDYHKIYPTIYHLRNELMNTNEKKDIRLVYLAIAHIMKHRGHFLMEHKVFSLDNQLLESIENFNELFKEYYCRIV